MLKKIDWSQKSGQYKERLLSIGPQTYSDQGSNQSLTCFMSLQK